MTKFQCNMYQTIVTIQWRLYFIFEHNSSRIFTH